MQDIIQKLYDIHLKDDSYLLGIPNKENLNKEWELYNYLYKNLSTEYKDLFLQYANLRTERQSEETKNAYTNGFKVAIKLIIESSHE